MKMAMNTNDDLPCFFQQTMTHAYKVFIKIEDAEEAHEFLMAHVKSFGTASTWRQKWQLKYNKEMKSVAQFNKRTMEMEAQTDEPEEEKPETREMETQTEMTMELYDQLIEILNITKGVMERF